MSGHDLSLTLPEGETGRAFRWAHQGARRVTVVVKSTSALAHGHPARRIPSEPIVEDGHTGELAPFLNGVGITIVGRPGRFPELAREGQPLRVRAALARGPVVWQKRVELSASDPRMHDDAYARSLLGPMPPADARRRHCLGRFARELEPRLSRFSPGEPLSLPDGFDFRYFHSAPADQQVARIVGDEWLILEGYERLERLETRLSTGPWVLRWMRGREAPVVVDGAFDSITVDVDRGTVTLLWRATFVLPPDAPSPLFLQVLPAGPVAKGADPPSTRQAPSPATVVFTEAPSVSMPFTHAARPRSTTELDPDELARAIMPFDVKAGASLLGAAREVHPATIDARPPSPAGLTATLLPHQVARALEPSAPLPFQKGPPSERTARPEPNITANPASPPAPPAPLPMGGLPAPAPPRSAPSPSGPHAELFAAIARGERTFYGIDLRGADLANVDLSGLTLSGANLRGAKLVGANLRGARLSEAKLDDADLTGACLVDADLTSASLQRACLDRVDASGATLEGASLERARASHARFTRARAARAILARGRWDDCSFEGADLRSLDWTGASLARAVLTEADLTEARLGDVRAPEARLERAKLDRARLDGAGLEKIEGRSCSAEDASWERASLVEGCLENAVLSNGRFTRARLDGAKLGHAVLVSASLQGATARDARFEHADLSGADLRQLQAAKACFEGALLRGAQGARADLSEASLRDAVLDEASFRPAQLAGADLTGASLVDADLRDANLSGANLTRAVRRGTKLAGAKLKSIIE